MRAGLLAVLLVALGAFAQAAWARPLPGHFDTPQLVVETEAHNGSIFAAVVDRSGEFLVTGSLDKTVRVWSTSEGRLLRTIRMPAGPGEIGMVYTVAISPDGLLVAAGGYMAEGANSIYLFDRRSGRMVRRLGVHGNTFGLAFSRDGRRLASASERGVHLYDVGTGKEINSDTDYFDRARDVAFAPDGRIVASGYDRQLRVYSSELVLLRPPVPTRRGKQPCTLAFSPDGRKLAVSYNNSAEVDLYDGRTLAYLSSPRAGENDSGALPLIAVAWSLDGSTLFAAGHDYGADDKNYVRAWGDAGSGRPSDLPISDDTIMGLVPLAGGDLVVTAHDPRIVRIDRGGRPRWSVDRKRSFFLQTKLQVSPDARRVQIASNFETRQFHFDQRQRVLSAGAPTSDDLSAPDTAALPITEWEGSETPRLDGRRLPLGDYNQSRSISVAPDGKSFLMGTDFSLRRYSASGTLVWSKSVTSAAWRVNQSRDGRLGVAALSDGTIRWFRTSDGDELLALFVDAARERWVAWTPGGYYAASPGGEDLIRWVQNRDADEAPGEYPIGAFREEFYRPDIIDLVLEELDPEAAVRLARASTRSGQANTPAQVLAAQATPTVKIFDPVDGTFLNQPNLEVAFRIEGKPGSRVTQLRALVDNREVGVRPDIQLDRDGVFEGAWRIPLEGRSPTLTLVAHNEYGAGIADRVKLRGGIDRADRDRPVLYVLAIGVGDYMHHPKLNLDFADDDAIAFAERMDRQKGKGKLYRDVVVRRLVDTTATGADIDRGLEWLRGQSLNPQDLVVIFLSSHGEVDDLNEFRMIAHDSRLSSLSEMRTSTVAWDVARRTIIKIGSQVRTIVFLDACRSGTPSLGGASRADADRLANELAASGGKIVIFSASTGNQVAVEDPNLRHGVFTSAILDVLDGKTNIRNQVDAKALAEVVRERVAMHTGGQQTPVMTPSDLAATFTLFAIP